MELTNRNIPTHAAASLEPSHGHARDETIGHRDLIASGGRTEDEMKVIPPMPSKD
jgi:hypothetical protein